MKNYFFILLCLSLTANAQVWQAELNGYLRFDHNKVETKTGTITSYPFGQPFFGVEISRSYDAKNWLGGGITRSPFGFAWAINGYESSPLKSITSIHNFTNLYAFYTRPFLRYEKFSAELGGGCQFIITTNFRSDFENGNSPDFPQFLSVAYSSKGGVSPVPFARINLKYAVNKRLNSFFRGQANVGFRPILQADLYYKDLTSIGEGTIYAKGTGLQLTYGLQYVFQK